MKGASPAATALPGLRPEPVPVSAIRRVSTGAIEASAEISPCGRYRYWLGRKWDFGATSLPIIMLNPSTADASNDDPTIRRCMGFARREGFGGIRVFNLFAYRATSPGDMRAAVDPVGPGNDSYLNEAFDIARCFDMPVLAAWGAHGSFMRRGEAVMRFAADHRVKLVSLGTTAAGHPRHPLYVKADQPFEPFLAQGMRPDTPSIPNTPEKG